MKLTLLFKTWVQKFSHQPLWTLIACLILLCAHLILDGTVLSLWQLYHNRQALENRIADLTHKNGQVERRLKKLSERPFLEKEVKDRFNMVGEEDIIFIFSEENPQPAGH